MTHDSSTSRPYVIAEAGINHNGDLAVALALVDAAAGAGADAVKFQKRTPELCVPESQRHIERDTPWGRVTYMEYRQLVELDVAAWAVIADRAAGRGVELIASVWDTAAYADVCGLGLAAVKVPSAGLTHGQLVDAVLAGGTWPIISTGMSTVGEILALRARIERAQRADKTTGRPTIMHAVSAYPTEPSTINLRRIGSLRAVFAGLAHRTHPYGYSGHEPGFGPTVAAVALGATVIERHLTLDRSMWGTDHAASLEPDDFAAMVDNVHQAAAALGESDLNLDSIELPAREKLRTAP